MKNRNQTPNPQEYATMKAHEQGKYPGKEAPLNPLFIEQIMGYPKNWTHIELDETKQDKDKRCELLGNAIVPQVAYLLLANMLDAEALANVNEDE